MACCLETNFIELWSHWQSRGDGSWNYSSEHEELNAKSPLNQQTSVGPNSNSKSIPAISGLLLSLPLAGYNDV